MPRYTKRHLVVLITLLMLVSAINVADKELLAPVADAVRADLNMSDTQLGAVRSAVSIILFSVVPPETKATTISASDVILNLVIALLSLMIGVVSDATELRLAFGGAVILMFALGTLASLVLLRTISYDINQQQAIVESRIIGTNVG